MAPPRRLGYISWCVLGVQLSPASNSRPSAHATQFVGVHVCETRRNAAFGGSAEESLTELRFPGQYFDQEIGQSYNFARSYSDATARYQQADPLNITDGPNFYSYAHQSPNRYVDPEGGVAGAAIGAAGRAVGSGLALGAQLCVRNARCRSAAMNAASAAVSSVTRLLYRTCYLYEIRGEGCVDNRIVYIGITSQMDPEARCNQSHPAIRWIQPVCPNCKLNARCNLRRTPIESNAAQKRHFASSPKDHLETPC